MYGRNVELRLSKDVVVTVWIWCTPLTTQDILEQAAFDKLKSTLEQVGNVPGGLSA